MGTVDQELEVIARSVSGADAGPTSSVSEPPTITAAAEPTAETPQPAAQEPECRWGLVQCVLFRFVLIYYTLYFLPFPIDQIPWSSLASPLHRFLPFPMAAIRWGYLLAQWYREGTQHTVMWVGKSVLGLGDRIIIQSTGSGDTMFEYVKALCFLVVALAGTALWSILDRKRPAYPRLHMIFRTYIRLALAGVMLGYGLAKVFPMQFQVPGPDRLLQTYGNSSPMGLLWTFMGYSPAYTIFAGAMETIGALLLMFRRTTALGGLFTAGVMLNVVMLNFCYDVPVKLYSMHLLLAALVVALPDLPRVMRVLLLNREVAPAPRLRFPKRWMNWTLVAVELAVVLLMVVPGVVGANTMWKRFGPGSAKPALYGLYEVESFELNGELKPPLLTDATRWRRFSVTKFGSVLVQSMTDVREGFALKNDETLKTLELTPRASGQSKGGPFALKYTEPEPGKLVLEGPFRGGELKAVLKKMAEADAPLMGRPFHWIQEMPYNR